MPEEFPAGEPGIGIPPEYQVYICILFLSLLLSVNQPVISSLFYLKSKLLTFGFDNSSVIKNMYYIRNNIVKKSLIVSNYNKGVIWPFQFVYTRCYNPESINIQSTVGLIKNCQLRLKHCHLENLISLFLTSRKSNIYSATRK